MIQYNLNYLNYFQVSQFFLLSNFPTGMYYQRKTSQVKKSSPQHISPKQLTPFFKMHKWRQTGITILRCMHIQKQHTYTIILPLKYNHMI